MRIPDHVVREVASLSDEVALSEPKAGLTARDLAADLLDERREVSRVRSIVTDLCNEFLVRNGSAHMSGEALRGIASHYLSKMLGEAA